MSLVLEIEYLLGVAFAAREPGNEVPDWPPQPDRVFSALVAAWGARRECDGERRALEWLEAQPAPQIAASGGYPRTAPTVFVPPNDPESSRVGNAAVMPALRSRQARRFPAFRPDDPVISLIWREAAPDRDTLTALGAVAADTAYIGHSASPTRCRFYITEQSVAGEPARRRVYRGRLAELERDFRARRRPGPGSPVRAGPDRAGEAISGVFFDRWLVLEHVEGEMPDIRAATLVAKELRNALMSGYRAIGLGEAIPAAVSGHSPDGRPSSEPHLAMAPLAFVGTPHASGAVFGFALIPPRDVNLLDDHDFRRAFRQIMPSSTAPDDRTRRSQLVLGRLGLAFEAGNVSARRSLDPAPYIGAARVWASCTPIVLDRHLKEKGNGAREAEIAGLIKQACKNIGLPEPVGVAAGKHSAIEGAPSAYPPTGAPRWTGWKLPESLASRQLSHAVVEFPVAVRGPVILGAGRFCGLGLCRPLDPGRNK